MEESLTAVTDNILHSESRSILTKTVKSYPNDNPWLTAQLKEAIQAKCRAFATGHRTEARAMQTALKREIAQAKRLYKEQVEAVFHNGNMRQAW